MADDLISRQAAIKLLRGECVGKYPSSFYFGLLAAADELRKLTTVDAVEVVHGHWEYGKWEQGHWVKGNERCRCSVCHRDFAVDNSNIWHGCPHCLAKMDGDGNG